MSTIASHSVTNATREGGYRAVAPKRLKENHLLRYPHLEHLKLLNCRRRLIALYLVPADSWRCHCSRWRPVKEHNEPNHQRTEH